MSEIEDLKERISWLESLLMGTDEDQHLYTIIFSLSHLEAVVLGVLMAKPVATRDALMFAMYSGRANDWPNENNLSQYIFRLRAKLGSIGVKIISARGPKLGLYHITETDKAKIKACLQEKKYEKIRRKPPRESQRWPVSGDVQQASNGR